MKLKKKSVMKILLLVCLITAVFAVSLLCSGVFSQNAAAAETGVRYHGDVDDDGEITAADARLALRACVGLEDYAPGTLRFVRADYDKDGEITASDARMILRTAVGLEPLFQSDYADESAELPLSDEDLAKLKEEEEAKQKDLEKETEPTVEEKGPEGPSYQGDGINTCMVCGKPCRPDEFGNDACAFGGCTRSFSDFVCQHCDEHVPANTCHTCTNPTYIITEEPEK